MPPTEVIIAGAVLLLAGVLFLALLAQWQGAQAMALAIPPKAPCGFMPPS